MKITSIRATPVNIPYTASYVFSHGSIKSLTKTIVEVETDQGATGLGEVADGNRAADVEKMGETLIGVDIREINTAERRCLPGIRYTPWGNVAGMRRAFGGIEMAMWDARARIEEVPLHVLLGGAVRSEIALSEYFGYRLPGVSEKGEQTPEEVAEYCARMIEEHGATNFEGKVATVDLDEEVRMIRLIREAIGDRPLKLDANGGWTVQTARDAIRRMDDYVIHYYEEPVETYEEMAQLRPFTRANFSTHVMDLPKAVRLNCPDTMVTNLVEMGGIARTVEFIRACEQFDVGFRFHSGETSVASAAYLQVSAAMEHIREPSQTLFRWYADDVCNEGTPVPKNGVVPVPTGPGLGVTLDQKAMKRCHERFLEEGEFPKTDNNNRTYRTHFTRI
ncbi:MAG TPA: chloromuconate cycloisomerase [Gammaproteobacteria bacterium]|jgi:glucarate dehydratase|nr:chloromuconate cycloisomerase [Gammaproteobacteria bacterium]HIN60017.1 chloromuconate cycloisomerase [Gammaproteobacteria bacterium]